MEKEEGLEFELDSLYLAAAIKLSAEQRKGQEPAEKQRLQETLHALGLDPTMVQSFLAQHEEELILTCQALGL